jgi:hypothetical protein
MAQAGAGFAQERSYALRELIEVELRTLSKVT